MTVASAYVGEPVRILVWCWGRRGGGPRYTLEIARSLARLPCLDVHTSVSRQSELFAETKALGLPGHDVDTYSGVFSAALRTLAIPRITGRFTDYLERQRIDVVLCAMSHPWSGWMARFLRSTKRRYVLTVHDASQHPGDEHFGWEWILRNNLQHADGVLVLSEHVRSQLTKRYPYPESRIRLVPHGPFRFHGKVSRSAAPVRPRRLLFFGRILPYKGLPLLIDAFNSIADRHDLELAVVGRGDLGGNMGRLLSHPRIRLDNRWIPESELANVFAAADVVVVPCIEASQSGVVAAAYGMGLPVVVTPVGGLREQVSAGKTGMIATDISSQALAEAITALCTDSSLYARCCEGAQQAGEMERIWGNAAETIAAHLGKVRSMPSFDGLKPAPSSRLLAD